MTKEQIQEVKNTFRSKYYNAVSDCCFNVLALDEAKLDVDEGKLSTAEYKEIIEDAHEWFMIHFFEEQGLE